MNAPDLAKMEAVIGHLSDWADWLKGYRVRLGYSPKSAGFQSGGVVSEESSDDYSGIDQTRYEMIDACVDDLSCIHRAAIHRRYLSSVYRMRDYEQMLLEAHEILLSAFRKKGVIW